MNRRAFMSMIGFAPAVAVAAALPAEAKAVASALEDTTRYAIGVDGDQRIAMMVNQSIKEAIEKLAKEPRTFQFDCKLRGRV